MEVPPSPNNHSEVTVPKVLFVKFTVNGALQAVRGAPTKTVTGFAKTVIGCTRVTWQPPKSLTKVIL